MSHMWELGDEGSWLHRLLRLIAPAKPERLLPAGTLADAEAQMRRFEWALTASMTAFMFLGLLPAAWVVRQIASALDGPADEVLYSTRSLLDLPEATLAMSLAFLALPSRIVFGLWRAAQLDLYDRYIATRYGWDGARANALLIVICVGLSIWLVSLTRDRADVIGPRGVCAHRLHPHLQPYSAVTQVCVVELASWRRVDVDFASGEALTLDPMDIRELDSERIERIAACVAQRAGVPIIRRPP